MAPIPGHQPGQQRPYAASRFPYSDEIIVVATFFDVSHNSLLKKQNDCQAVHHCIIFAELRRFFCHCQWGDLHNCSDFFEKATINLQFTCTGYALTMHQTIFGMVEANRQ